MKKIKNKIAITITMLIILSLLLLLPVSTIYAGFQSIRTGTGLTKIPTDWIKEIRQMEGANQGMGLNETIDTAKNSNLVATSTPNNIDVHLLKNTEYGATILLGASDYGKQGSSINDRRMDKGNTSMNATVQASTTGNVSGVYEMGYKDMSISNYNYYEWVAGGGTTFINTYINPRYIDRYTSSSNLKPGDATIETRSWHGARYASFATGGNGFIRGRDGAFSYYSLTSGSSFGSYSAYARPAVVAGSGL